MLLALAAEVLAAARSTGAGVQRVLQWPGYTVREGALVGGAATRTVPVGARTEFFGGQLAAEPIAGTGLSCGRAAPAVA